MKIIQPLIKIAVVGVIFFSGFYLGHQIALSPSDGQPAASVSSAEIILTLRIDNGQGEIRNFGDLTQTTEATVFDLLQAVSAVAANNFSFTYKDYGAGMGAFITGIDGRANDPLGGQYWQYWVNGQYSKIGASNYHLKSGDLVEWKYLKGQIN